MPRHLTNFIRLQHFTPDINQLFEMSTFDVEVTMLRHLFFSSTELCFDESFGLTMRGDKRPSRPSVFVLQIQ